MDHPKTRDKEHEVVYPAVRARHESFPEKEVGIIRSSEKRYILVASQDGWVEFHPNQHAQHAVA